MGSQQFTSYDDQQFPVSPLINKLRNNLKLTVTNNITSSFVSYDFALEIKKNSGKISRKSNPFCPVIIETDFTNKIQENLWLSCCLISPIMAIALPKNLVDNKYKYNGKAQVQFLKKNNEFAEVRIKTIHVIEENTICLIILQTPLIQLGWAGLTFLQTQEQITNQSFKIINHPHFKYDEQNKSRIYDQQIEKVFYKLQNQFIGTYKTMTGSLIFKIIEKKPYIVGIQKSETSGQFITKKTLEMISNAIKNIINNRMEFELIRAIDVQQLELMQKL